MVLGQGLGLVFELGQSLGQIACVATSSRMRTKALTTYTYNLHQTRNFPVLLFARIQARATVTQ